MSPRCLASAPYVDLGPRGRHRYRLVAELAMRVTLPGGHCLIDRRPAVRAMRRHHPGRASLDAVAGRRLPLRFVLALDVVAQRALAQRRHVDDDPAPVSDLVTNGH